MEPGGQKRWWSSTDWHHAARELIADACMTLSALIALVLLVLLWPKAVVRVMGFLLPPARPSVRLAALRATDARV